MSVGIYKKYRVLKADTGKDVQYRTFVLRTDGKDKHAMAALKAYAESCEAENPTLSRELLGMALLTEWPKSGGRGIDG